MSTDQPNAPISAQAASDAVGGEGWRYLLGTLTSAVPVASLAEGAAVATTAAAACGAEADGHLRLDLRPDRVLLELVDRAGTRPTSVDVRLALAISEALRQSGHRTGGATRGEPAGPVQGLEIAVDTLDAGAIRPFWKAVLAYVDEPGSTGPTAALVDPAGRLPAVWFQQMSEPRPQRNRLHLDLRVAHDEADARIQQALDAGGRLISDAEARAFWVLADAEGNEVCVCTWQDRG